MSQSQKKRAVKHLKFIEQEEEQQDMIESNRVLEAGHDHIERNSLSRDLNKTLRKEISEHPKCNLCRCKCENTMPPIEMMENLKNNHPSFLIDGKWSPIAYVLLLAFICGMGFALKYAIDAYPSYIEPNPSYFTNFIWRFIIFMYGVCILLYILKMEGLWPLWSFTMLSWNLLTLRYLISSLYHLGADSNEFPVLFAMSETLRFPSLVCNAITVSLWWVVLTPSICAMYAWRGPTTKDSKKRIKKFLKFNVSPVLINIHFLNLPLSALDHILSMRVLTFFDLWCGMFVALCYVIIYLFVMDRKGLYLYHVLLSPRPHWCGIAYAFVIALFVAYWFMWNAV